MTIKTVLPFRGTIPQKDHNIILQSYFLFAPGYLSGVDGGGGYLIFKGLYLVGDWFTLYTLHYTVLHKT